MAYVCMVFMFVVILGFIGVAANPSPVYGAMGLVVASLAGCGVLVMSGGSFISLILLLVYLGGMLVVFAYSVALSAEAYPETWGGYVIQYYVVGYVCLVVGVVFMGGLVISGLGVGSEVVGFCSVSVDVGGVVLLYSVGGWLLLLCGFGLMVSLLVVIELTWGGVWGTLRVVE